MFCSSAWHRCAEIRVSPGGWGRNIFLHRVLPFYSVAFGASGPVPRGTFPSPEKYPKGRIGNGPFRWGPSPMYPSPTTTQRGLAPFGFPPASPADCPGTPTNFICAAGMNPALRQGFRLWRKRLYAELPARVLTKHVPLSQGGRRSLVDRPAVDQMTKT